MGRLQLKSFILLCWALTLMFSAAQREYFIQTTNSTWSDARNYCQACFKELVTLTPDNIQGIARNISCDHWIGLRKNFNFNNSTNNLTSTPASYTGSYPTTEDINSNFTSNDTSRPIFNWTQWANGDPLAFQNWYPGWPVPKPSPKPRNKTTCCSCSCTCPARTTTPATTPAMTPNTTSFNKTGTVTNTVTSFTDLTGNTDESSFSFSTDQTMTTQSTSSSFTTSAPWTTTEMPVEAACVRSPMLEPEEPEDDDSNDVNYIEDSCVAMLSFGPWIERNCLDHLPFICYEDRFNGKVTVTSITSEYASLTWEQAPGNINHYRVEVYERSNRTVCSETANLSYELNNLVAGTHYSVQVIPVKCDRDLNPETESFYTAPNKVINLAINDMTKISISLNWRKPDGNLDFYDLTYQAENQSTMTIEVNGTMSSTTVNGLTPGRFYNFTIVSGVNDRSKWSDGVNISGYTYPDQVYNLAVVDNTDNSFVVTWTPPHGCFRDILVEANCSNCTYFSKAVSGITQNVTVTDLPPGAEIQVYVTVRLNDTIVGVTQTTTNFTTPEQISNLSLTSMNDSVDATWSPPTSSFSSFTVKLYLNGSSVNCTKNLNVTKVSFNGLKNGANYTVEVRAASGSFQSSAVNNSIFTLPNPPTDVSASNRETNNITFVWKEPANTASPSYNVRLSSSFWGQMWSYNTTATNYTFPGLKSGTNYSFEVRTVAGSGEQSPSVGCTNYTMEDKKEISLSMLCTSTTSLLCDSTDTRTNVFEQLRQHFAQLLNGSIFWDLEVAFK